MQAEYAAAYPDLYRHHWWWRVREEILLNTVANALGPARGHARLLDVGCGAALFFDALEPFGDVHGIESDASAVARAGRWRDHVTVGLLDEQFAPERPFDLVLLLDLLEHCDDPDAVLRHAHSVLAPGGTVLLTVPAYQWLWTTHDELNEHKRRYTPGEIRRALQRAGLQVESIQFLFQSLVLPKMLVKVRESIATSTPTVPRIPAPAINRALTSWYRAEHRWAGRLPFGGSILAIARRGEDRGRA